MVVCSALSIYFLLSVLQNAEKVQIYGPAGVNLRKHLQLGRYPATARLATPIRFQVQRWNVLIELTASEEKVKVDKRVQSARVSGSGG